MSRVESGPSLYESELDRLHEAIAEASQVTVEFGSGNRPLFNQPGFSDFDPQNLYVGVNIDPLQHLALARRIELTKEVGDCPGFALLSELEGGVIGELPIPAESVDNVFMGNVFGEPNSDRIMPSFQHRKGKYWGKYKGSSSFKSKINTLHEVGRILKPGGTLAILEYISPYRKWGDTEVYYAMAEIIEKNGFEVTSKYGKKTLRAEWQYAGVVDEWHSHSYLVMAEKSGIDPTQT